MPSDDQAAAADTRLVASPVFLLSAIRSGSTLLRSILNSHPAVCAPHELHLRYLKVSIDSEYTPVGDDQSRLHGHRSAMDAVGPRAARTAAPQWEDDDRRQVT